MTPAQITESGASTPSLNIISEESRIPLSSLTIQPFPGSKKIYRTGSRPDVRVPMREIQQTPSQRLQDHTEVQNPSVIVYDTSGPYTDPAIQVDVRQGLHPVRKKWIAERQDIEPLPEVSSLYGRARAQDPALQAIRFSLPRPPLRAKSGYNVTQLHYARKGIITPEMEYIAIRENQAREEEGLSRTTTGKARSCTASRPKLGRGDPLTHITPNLSVMKSRAGRAIIPGQYQPSRNPSQ